MPTGSRSNVALPRRWSAPANLERHLLRSSPLNFSSTWMSRLAGAALVASVAGGFLLFPLGQSGCSDEICFPEEDAGCSTILRNQVDVIFVSGTTTADIDAINAMIGATILIVPVSSTTLRIRLPAGWCYERGRAFYEKQPSVASTAPALNVCSPYRANGARTQQ
jgi:hypothetical protein